MPRETATIEEQKAVASVKAWKQEVDIIAAALPRSSVLARFLQRMPVGSLTRSIAWQPEAAKLEALANGR